MKKVWNERIDNWLRVDNDHTKDILNSPCSPSSPLSSKPKNQTPQESKFFYLMKTLTQNVVLLFDDWVLFPSVNYYLDNEQTLNILALLLLNGLQISYVFLGSGLYVVLSALMTIFSLWNTYNLFTTSKTYQIIRDRHSGTPTSVKRLKLSRVNHDTDEQLGSRYNIWEAHMWNYSELQKLLFCYFSPFQTLGLTITTATKGILFLKLVILLVCYLQAYMLTRLFSKFEMKQDIKDLIQGEVLKEQMLMCDKIWYSANKVLTRRSLAMTPMPENLFDDENSRQVMEELIPSAPTLQQEERQEKTRDIYPIAMIIASSPQDRQGRVTI